VFAPVLSFCDIWLNGEGNWRGQLRDNYLEVLPLDQMRAAFRTQQHGGIPWWLPQWNHAILEDKDVEVPTAQYRGTSPEKSHHMLGIGLLLDIGFWPIMGTNQQALSEFYAVQDEFGIADARFHGYWSNQDLIGGQTDLIRASAYRKPAGGALVVVYNTTKAAQHATLLVDWDRLKSDGPLDVFDAYTKKPIALNGKSISLDISPLNYRLLWAK